MPISGLRHRWRQSVATFARSQDRILAFGYAVAMVNAEGHSDGTMGDSFKRHALPILGAASLGYALRIANTGASNNFYEIALAIGLIVLSVGCFVASIWGLARLPPQQPRHPVANAVALRRRRLGGQTFSRKRRMLIDQEGVYESQYGLIPWRDIVGIRKLANPLGSTIQVLELCVRDPRSYANRGTALQARAYALNHPFNTRYGAIWIVVDPYSVDLDTAYTLARTLRHELPDPFIDDWSASMSDEQVENRLGCLHALSLEAKTFASIAQRPAEAQADGAAHRAAAQPVSQTPLPRTSQSQPIG